MEEKPKISADSWPNLQPFPPHYKRLSLDGTLTSEQFLRVAGGYLPTSAEEKWLIDVAEGWVYFYRVATGRCIYQLQLLPHEDHYITPYLHVNNDPQQYRSPSDQFDVEMVAFLLDTYIFGRKLPIPQPANLARQWQAVHQAHLIGKVEDRPIFISLTDL